MGIWHNIFRRVKL